MVTDISLSQIGAAERTRTARGWAVAGRCKSKASRQRDGFCRETKRAVTAATYRCRCYLSISIPRRCRGLAASTASPSHRQAGARGLNAPTLVAAPGAPRARPRTTRPIEATHRCQAFAISHSIIKEKKRERTERHWALARPCQNRAAEDADGLSDTSQGRAGTTRRHWHHHIHGASSLIRSTDIAGRGAGDAGPTPNSRTPKPLRFRSVLAFSVSRP